MPPNVVCTESYLIVGNFENEQEAINAVSFLKSKFCRFLVSSILLTQNITKSKFVFVPMQDFSKPWTDEELYKNTISPRKRLPLSSLRSDQWNRR